jgi:hypothetical protein
MTREEGMLGMTREGRNIGDCHGTGGYLVHGPVSKKKMLFNKKWLAYLQAIYVS